MSAPLDAPAPPSSPLKPPSARASPPSGPASSIDETVTILTAKVHQAKTHRPGKSVAYGNAKHVTGVEVPVDGIEALSEVLTRLEREPYRAVIRGKLKADVAWSEHQRRLLYPDTDEKTAVVTPPTLEERPRRWLCIDLDRLACPEHLDPADDPEEAVRWVLAQLPEWLQDVTCHWQWSSSAGVGEAGWAVLKMHLWFWLTTPLEDRALRSWARLSTQLVIDPALYSPAQLHYTAAPLFEGLEDPLNGRRSGLCRGWKGDAAEPPDELVRWRELEEARRQESQRLQRERPWEGSSGGASEDERLKAWVLAGCEKIRLRLIESAKGSRHDTLRSVCGSLANYITWGVMTEAEALDLLGYSPLLHESGRGEGELERALEWSLGRARLSPQPRPVLGRGRGDSGGMRDSSARSVGGSKSLRSRPRPRSDGEDGGGSGGDGGDGGDDGSAEGEEPRERPDVSELEEGAAIGLGYNLIEVRQGAQRWTFQDSPDACMVHEDAEGEERFLAIGCWPVALTRRVEGGEHGVRYAFYTRQGTLRYGTLAASAWTDRAGASIRAREAAEVGVQIYPNQGASWAMALGQWAAQANDPPTESIVSRPGWHQEDGCHVYVNGERIFGADWRYDGGEVRSGRAGTLEGWQLGTRELVTTPGLKLALGVSLAGALLGPLGWPIFLVHFAGRSSSGKTSAARLGASVWYAPHEHLQYNASERGLTLAAESFSGALVVLDEIKEIEPGALARVIHTITDGRSRTLAKQSGDGVRETRRWSLTGLSTGEITTAEHLGSIGQGGQAVRAIDVRIQLGEVTRDAEHAALLARWLTRCHGVLGDAWAATLAARNAEEWEDIGLLAEHIAASIPTPDDPELGRIIRALALSCGALHLAAGWGLAGLDFSVEDARALLRWAVERIRQERGAVTSPEERALRALREIFEAKPHFFPTEADYRDGRAREVVGVVVLEAPPDDPGGLARPVPSGTILTTEGMLKNSEVLKQAGVGPRQFLAWMKEVELGDGGGGRKRRVGGVESRWHLLNLTSDTPSALREASQEAS